MDRTCTVGDTVQGFQVHGLSQSLALSLILWFHLASAASLVVLPSSSRRVCSEASSTLVSPARRLHPTVAMHDNTRLGKRSSPKSHAGVGIGCRNASLAGSPLGAVHGRSELDCQGHPSGTSTPFDSSFPLLFCCFFWLTPWTDGAIRCLQVQVELVKSQRHVRIKGGAHLAHGPITEIRRVILQCGAFVFRLVSSRDELLFSFLAADPETCIPDVTQNDAQRNASPCIPPRLGAETGTRNGSRGGQAVDETLLLDPKPCRPSHSSDHRFILVVCRRGSKRLSRP